MNTFYTIILDHLDDQPDDLIYDLTHALEHHLAHILATITDAILATANGDIHLARECIIDAYGLLDPDTDPGTDSQTLLGRTLYRFDNATRRTP